MLLSIILLSILVSSTRAVDCTGKPNLCPDMDDGCPTMFPPKTNGDPNDLCFNIGVASFANQCRNTCGTCCAQPCTTTENVNCVNWVHNNFCQNPGYTYQQKIDNCGKSCGLCT